MDIAGRDITESLAFNIRRMTGVALQSSSELEIVRLIKEQNCFISKDPVRDEKKYGSHYSRNNPNNELMSTYKLPDGQKFNWELKIQSHGNFVLILNSLDMRVTWDS